MEIQLREAEKEQEYVEVDIFDSKLLPIIKEKEKTLYLAIEKVNTIKSNTEKLNDYQLLCLRAYCDENSQKLKECKVEAGTQMYKRVIHYMRVHLGFNISKNGADIQILSGQIRDVLKLVGEQFPNLGRLELFAAFDYALGKNPELCKSYDSAKGLSSFTSIYVCQIVKFYLDNKVDCMPEVNMLCKNIQEKESAKEYCLRAVKMYRNELQMILSNYAAYLDGKKLVFSSAAYINVLYDLLEKQEFGILCTYMKGYFWAKSASVLNREKRIEIAKRQTIFYSFDRLGCSVVELAAHFGFFTAPTKSIDFAIEMEIDEILDLYGKGVVSIFPLQPYEFSKPIENKGIGTLLKESYQTISK